MVERALIAVGVGLARRPAEARSAADHRLIDALPGPVLAEQIGPHEGLVVEAGADERREEVIDRAEVECERRPAVLAYGAEAVIKFDLGRAQVWRDPAGSASQGDERIRLLGAGAQDPARPVIFERAPDEMHAVGYEGGGERVAGIALIEQAVESEGERARTVDRADAGETKRLAHPPRPAASAAPSGRGSPGL